MTLTADIQAFDLGELVVLFDLDLSLVDPNLGIVRFTPNTAPVGDGTFEQVMWNGNGYIPIDVETEGFEESAKGTLPRPLIRVSNVNQSFGGYIVNYDDMTGALLTRTRTFSKYLDGNPGAGKCLSVDEFYIERKANQNPVFVEFELRCLIDCPQKMLPGRQVLRDYCTKIYRYYTNGDFDYSQATCRYNGSGYWDALGNPQTDPAKDRCGKRRSDCKLRFSDGPLPTWAFFGVERVDV